MTTIMIHLLLIVLLGLALSYSSTVAVAKAEKSASATAATGVELDDDENDDAGQASAKAATAGVDDANEDDDTIHVVIVSCGENRAAEALTSMRSILLTSRIDVGKKKNRRRRRDDDRRGERRERVKPGRRKIKFHIFHQEGDGNDVFFADALSSWQRHLGLNNDNNYSGGEDSGDDDNDDGGFAFSLYPAHSPDAYSDLFAPCACQRLFLHDILPPSVQRIIYVDSDTLFLADVAELWSEFDTFDESTFLAAAPEHEPTHKFAWYKDNATHPYYNQNNVRGLNSGVLLMDLTKLRAHPWNDELESYRKEYDGDLRYYDQDLINVYFHSHPNRLKVLSCSWNYRADHCYYRPHCLDNDGVPKVLHGNRGTFHKRPGDRYGVRVFALTYDAFANKNKKVAGGDTVVMTDWVPCLSVLRTLWNSLTEYASQVTSVSNRCEAMATIVLQQLQKVCAAAGSDDGARGSEERAYGGPDEL